MEARFDKVTSPVEEWVVYSPPKSVSFGHLSKPRDPRLAWSKTEQFVGGVADLELGHLIDLTYIGASEMNGAIASARRLEEARLLFGPEIEEDSRFHPRWKLNPSQITTAVQFAMDDDKFPEQEEGPTRFHFYYRFQWPEFKERPYWEAENEPRKLESRLGVILGSRQLFLQPFFVFPAPWNSEYLRDVLGRIEKVAPFRFRDQYFQRSLPTKKARPYGRTLKLPKDWRAQTL